MSISIAIQDLDEPTASWILREAETRGLSVEAVVLELIRQGITSLQLRTYDDLDSLAGTWTDQEADEFLDAIADLAQVDEKLWQ